MENGAFEDASPIQNGDFPACHVRLLEGIQTRHLSSTVFGEFQALV